MTTSTRVEDDRPDLASLLERVEKATGPDRELDCLIYCALYPEYAMHDRIVGSVMRTDEPPPVTVAELTRSIDAALALVERMLPGQWHIVLDDALANMWQQSAPQMHLHLLPLAIIAALLRSLSQGSKP